MPPTTQLELTGPQFRPLSEALRNDEVEPI